MAWCGVSAASAEKLSFNRDVRPILSENCFHCHGPDKDRREAELRLDDRAAAIEALALAPGRPEQSEMIRRIFSTDATEQMPPVDSNRSLTAQQKAVLKRWVEEGAEYQAHWAFVPPTRPVLPEIAPAAKAAAVAAGASVAPPGGSPKVSVISVRNAIDTFIEAKLHEQGLVPAAEADRRTLIRRLSFDLTGLPPKPEDVEAFVASREPDAYAKLVRRYLASPHYGERMAIPWLDLVRYADTIGFHNDVAIKVWPYRDYVIDAFNRNLPFDRFVREQIAGDLLPGATTRERVASGYNRLHRISGEGGIQDKEYLAKYAADRVRTTATVFMGVTMACAECHDHKFDPFTIKDFYSFAAIFSDLNEKGAYNLYGGFTRANLSEEMIFASAEQKAQIERHDAEIAQLKRDIDAIGDEALEPGRAAWEARVLRAASECRLEWQTQTPLAARSLEGTPLTIESDGSVLAGGKNPVSDTYEVTIPAPLDRVTAVRLEAVPDVRFPGDDVARAGSTFYLSEIEVSGQSGPGAFPQPLAISATRTAGSTELGYPASAVIDGRPETAVSFVRKRGGGIALHLAEPWRGGREARLIVRVKHSRQHPYQNLGRFLLSLHDQPSPDANPKDVPEAVLRALEVPREKRKAPQQKEIAAYYRTLAPELAALHEKLRLASEAREYLALTIPSMPVSKSVTPRPMRVLPRGNWMDDSGEPVEPAIPTAFGKLTPKHGERVTRLDLADWLVSPDNPLTARTFVNRVWRIFFGAGLTRTLEDLGSQGEWPSHPELLDWLAVDFRESGWDVKRLVTTIVTSEAYRRSSAAARELEERDPTNRFLARQARFRLDAELVRDNALAVAGLLVTDRIGGPSAKPYQPDGYYAALNFPRREYVPDIGDGVYRRGVYVHWQRTFLHPSLMAFDAPAREECTANRAASNTPLQALVLLNDPSYVEAARVFAERILRDAGASVSFEAKLHWAFARAVSRPPTKDEVLLLRGLWDKQRARYAADAAAARELISVGNAPLAKDLPLPELAAWTAVSRALLNLHETITRL
jgi:hypothetical protein